MKFASCLLGLSLAVAAHASIFHSDPEILVSAAFPPENINSQVMSGEKNKLFLSIENKAKKNATITRVTGLFLDSKNKPTHNTTTVRYGVRVITGSNVTLPYSFFVPAVLPGDRKLSLTLEHVTDGKVYQVQAYDGIVSVVNPPISIFDFQMITTYLMTLAILGGFGYLAYATFFPATRPKIGKPRKSAITSPVGPVTATAATGYQEEWIPEHHIKKSKTKTSTLSEGGATSASESEGPAKATKRKSRK